MSFDGGLGFSSLLLKAKIPLMTLLGDSISSNVSVWRTLIGIVS